MKITVPSPAKINLYLRVGPRRIDGFHTLVSCFCSLGLRDEIAFAFGDSDDVSMACDQPRVPCDETNLVLRAARLLQPHARRFSGTQVVLSKRVPMGGGLGGGSSNAAVALRVLAKQWNCAVSAQTLAKLAAELGSDVPFFMRGGCAICRGRGELVTPVAAPAAKGAVLLLPQIEMPTSAVYRRFDEMGLGTDLAQVDQHLPSLGVPSSELLSHLINDLEAPAFSLAPALAELRTAAEKTLARPVRMSGSGSTLFTICDEPAEASAAAQSIEHRLGVRAIPTALCPVE